MMTLSPRIMVQWTKIPTKCFRKRSYIGGKHPFSTNGHHGAMGGSRVPWITAAAFRLPSQTTAALQLPSTSWWPKNKVAESKRPPPRTASPYDASQRMARGDENKNHGQEGMRKLRWRWLENPIFSWRYAGDTSSNALCCHLFNEESELDVGNARRVVPSQVTRVWRVVNEWGL